MRATGIEKQSGGSSSRKFDNEKREKGGTNIYLFKCVSPGRKCAPPKQRHYLFYASSLGEALPTLSITKPSGN